MIFGGSPKLRASAGGVTVKLSSEVPEFEGTYFVP